MAISVRSLESARQATVRICNRAGEPHGQGLLLDLDSLLATAQEQTT